MERWKYGRFATIVYDRSFTPGKWGAEGPFGGGGGGWVIMSWEVGNNLLVVSL